MNLSFVDFWQYIIIQKYVCWYKKLMTNRPLDKWRRKVRIEGVSVLTLVC